VYKISKDKLNIEKINELKDSNGELIIENEAIARLLINNLFPNDNTHDDNEVQKDIRLRASEIYTNNSNDVPFEMHEVSQVISAQNP